MEWSKVQVKFVFSLSKNGMSQNGYGSGFVLATVLPSRRLTTSRLDKAPAQQQHNSPHSSQCDGRRYDGKQLASVDPIFCTPYINTFHLTCKPVSY